MKKSILFSFICFCLIVAIFILKEKMHRVKPALTLQQSSYELLQKCKSEKLKQMHLAARQLSDLNKKKCVSHFISNVKEKFTHYPDEDLCDKLNGYLVYYHSHRDHEHGHFHIFKYEPKAFYHLIAISVDAKGRAIKLFTVNQWVTGEKYLPSDKLYPLIENFHVDFTGNYQTLGMWLNYMITLYKPQIIALIKKRDAYLAQQKIQSLFDPLSSRQLDILSTLDISLDEQTSNIERLAFKKL